MAVIDEVRDLLETRLEDISAEETRLRNALSQLVDPGKRAGSGLRSGKLPRSQSITPATRRRKIAPRGQRQSEVVAAINSMPGSTVAELAKMTGIAGSQVHVLVGKLVSEKKARKDGAQVFPASAKEPKAPKASKASKPKAPKGDDAKQEEPAVA